MIDFSAIKHLLISDGPALSVYFPIGSPRPRGRARPPATRLRALITRADQALRRSGVAAEVAVGMLGAMVEIADGLEREQHQEEGFGFFASADRSRMLSLPASVPELLEVSSSFHVKPLLGVAGRDQRFHILAVDPNDARLYGATPYAWEELPLDILPDLDELRTPAGPMPREAAMLPDDLKGDLFRVAAAARLSLAGASAPVLLAAEPEIARYLRHLAIIPSLHPEGLLLDPFAIKQGELHARALAAMRSVVDAEPEAVVARATRPRAGKGVGTGLEEILARARLGRVEVAVVADDQMVRGEPHSPPVASDSAARAGGGPDLLNEVAVETLRHGGKAFTLPSERFPQGVTAVAIYRP